MKAKGSRIVNGIICLGIIASVLPFFVISMYAQPQADDFFFAAWFRDMGFADYMIANLSCCNGRYFSTMLVGFNPLSFGSIAAYPVLPVLTLSLLFLSLFILTQRLVPGEHRKLVPFISAMTFVILLNGLPSVSQGIYWANASMFHTWAAIFLIFFLSLMTWRPGVRGSRQLQLGLGILICAAIPGMNELAMLLLIGILLIRIILFRKTKTIELTHNWIWLATALAGAITVMLMPGTFSRIDALPDSMNLTFALINAAKLSVFMAGFQLQQPAFILWSVLLLILFSQINKPLLPTMFDRLRPIWMVAAASMIIVFALYFTSLYMLGSYPPWRVHNTVAITFQLLWYINLFYVSRFLRSDHPLHSQIWLRNLLTFLIFWTLLTDFTLKDPRHPIQIRGNVTQCWHDLLLTAPQYNRAIEERFRALEMAGSEDTIKVKPLPNHCTTLFFADVGPNPKELNNAIMAFYFQVGAVEMDTAKSLGP